MNANDVEDVLNLFLSKDYFDKWIAFIDNNCELFSESGDGRQDYTLVQYETYNEFNGFVEGQLHNACDTLGFKNEDFLESCKELTDANNPIVDVFCSLVISSTEFQLFADIMTDANKRKYFIQIIESWRTTLKSHRK